jgi:two-component sensor histidine kinase
MRFVSPGMPMRRYLRPSLRFRALPPPLRWSGTALLVLLACGARYLLYGATPVFPFLPFLPAVNLATEIFNRGSGFFATALSAVLAVYFFVEPTYSLVLRATSDTINVALFCVIGFFIAAVIEALHLAYVEAEQAHAETDAARARAEAGERERELLLAEFRHRVSNDLQRIAGLLTLQARHSSPEVAAALRDAANRVYVVARVHDRLARRDGHVLVDVREFLHDLVADLRASFTDLRPIGIFVEAESHMLSVSRTGAIGLIANELVTNAMKHAFPDEREGAITIRFYREEDDFLLTMSDNGVGLAERLPEPQGEGLRRSGMGSRLVRALTAQLGGHIETSARSGDGTTHVLRFPVTPPGDAEHPPFSH